MTTTVVNPVALVEIDGSVVVELETQTVSSLRSPVSQATVRMSHNEGPFDGTEQVAVSLGDQSGVVQTFSGKLNVDSATYAPAQVSISAQGPLYLTQEPTGIVDATAVPTVDVGDPPYQGPSFAKAWASKTDGEIITDILALYGITIVSIEDSGTVFGTIDPVRLRSDQSGWSLIEELDTITGYKTFDGPDGTVTRIAYSGLPGGSSFYSFTEGDNIRSIRRERNTGKVYNSVTVKGKTGIIAATGVYYDISASRVGTSPYIPTPPGTRDFTFQSDLIETETVAAACAVRMLRLLNRRTDTITLTVSPGHKYVRPGMTVSVTAPDANIDGTISSRVLEVRQTHGQDYTTQLILEGALGTDGTDPNQAPVAQIVYIIELEGTISGTLYVVTLDGSASYDLDGYIVDYLWSSSTGTITPIGDGSKATLIISGTWPGTNPTVTLRVTDNHGKYGYKTTTLIKTNKNTFVRDLWAAVATDLLFSIDGQFNWVSTTVPAYFIPEQAGDTYQLAAALDGTLYRVLLDGTYTLPATITNVRCLFISRDRTGIETSVAWAGGSDGKIWRSPDQGVTWFEQTTIAPGETIYAITESPFSPGDLYALQGRKIIHSYDAGVTWEILYTHPNPSVVAYRWAAGVTAENVSLGYAGFYGPDMTADASHLIERSGTTAIDTGTPADKPLRFTGLTLSLDSARILATDISTASEGRAWTADATISGNLTKKTAYVDATYGLPAHIIRDGKFPIVWGISDSHIWKSADEFSSFLIIKTLSGGEVGQMIGYGKLHAPVVVGGALYFLAQQDTTLDDSCYLIVLTSTGWTNRGSVGFTDSNTSGVQRHQLLRTLGGTLIAWHWDRLFSAYPPRISTDNGVTWSNMNTITDAIDIVQADDGTLYCYGQRTHGADYRACIYKSVDDGVTWTLVSSNWLFNDGSVAANVRINVAPLISTNLVMMNINGPRFSTDGGVTFSAPVYGGGIMGGNGDADWPIVIVGANRYGYSDASGAHGGRFLGGTISPPTHSDVLDAATAIQWFGKRITASLGAVTDAVGSAGNILESTDGGTTWATVSAYGSINGIAVDPDTNDTYVTWRLASGTGTVPDPYLGLVRKQTGGVGTLDDLTQVMYTTLGHLYYPYPNTATE